MFKYGNYIAKMEVDETEGILYGRVLNISAVVKFEGKTVEEAKQAFHRAVDAYIESCKKQGVEPDKPFSGKLPFRTTPEIHRDIYIAATRANKSINAWMEDVLSRAARQSDRQPESQPTPVALERQPVEISFAEYKRLLAQLQDKIIQLKNAIMPYLEDKTTSSFALLYKKIRPILKDKELPLLLEKVEAVQESLKSVQSQEAALLALTEQSSEANSNSLGSDSTIDSDADIDVRALSGR
jgi:predicted HicB family RNase H-like nuclease